MRILTVGIALLAASTAVLAQAPGDKQTEVFGQKIHYIEAGSGPNVILLHGLGGDWHNWGPTIPALAAGYHVLVPDQIGFGASDKPLIEYRVTTLVDFLEAFCKKTGIGKATVVGNSLGGWTAMAFTLAHPERVEKLVLVDSAGYSFSPPPTRETLLALNPSTVEGAKAVLRLIFAHPSWATDAAAEGLLTRHMSNNDGYTIDRFIDSILRQEDFLDGKLGGIGVPTLVVWGREDRLTPLASGERFAHDIGGAQTKVLDGCGHVPQLECAGEFNAALLRFLGSGNERQ
ncbi:MAG: alpha/beta fold hydrolase [Bryobacteraceae bacterium]|jgi:pimeloyl-ACP methyl ester carboxylesterase